MPIFDFECKECGHKFDILVANKDKDKVKCLQCGSRNVKQMLSLFATSSSSPISGPPSSPCQGCPGAGGCGMRF